MTRSIQSAIDAAGDVVTLLRNQTARAMTFPVPPEFANWRTEQAAWRESCVLFDQPRHMTDLFISGPDAVRLPSEVHMRAVVAPAPFVKQVRDTYRAPSPQASRGTTHGASQGAAS